MQCALKGDKSRISHFQDEFLAAINILNKAMALLFNALATQPVTAQTSESDNVRKALPAQFVPHIISDIISADHRGITIQLERDAIEDKRNANHLPTQKF